MTGWIRYRVMARATGRRLTGRMWQVGGSVPEGETDQAEDEDEQNGSRRRGGRTARTHGELRSHGG